MFFNQMKNNRARSNKNLFELTNRLHFISAKSNTKPLSMLITQPDNIQHPRQYEKSKNRIVSTFDCANPLENDDCFRRGRIVAVQRHRLNPPKRTHTRIYTIITISNDLRMVTVLRSQSRSIGPNVEPFCEFEFRFDVEKSRQIRNQEVFGSTLGIVRKLRSKLFCL